MDMTTIGSAAVQGAFSGAVYGGIEFGKAHAKQEKFDPAKFVPSVVMGAVIGTVASVMGIDYQSAQNYIANIGLNTALVWGVDTVGKAIVRHMPAPAPPMKKKGKKKVDKDAKPEKAEKKDEKADEKADEKDEKPADDSEE